ncbi:type II secretion system F family protein [Desulfonatronum sp. SC1]|uniref:type II secretion system F family protein n=1 Tax=Desulfonatronum sp. SC1 TaxID=2109626 RepID=UPI000D2FF22A|nr:type II secretion system F family protein [Desulfonatronum sp. SC1]PTN37522.1 type II secretion system F family protein [Desulfonatronum sp. SC1]
MPKYKYQAMTDAGTTVSGEVEADSEQAAKTKVAARGLIPRSVGAATSSADGKGAFSSLLQPKPTDEDLILFTKQFKTMLGAGMTVISLLDVLEHQTENQTLRQALATIRDDIRQGASLHAAFSKHPKIFNPLYLAMVRAGEISGTLTTVLERLIYLTTHENKVKKQIKSALTYPAVILVTLIGAFLFLLTFVVPQFISIFDGAGLELPFPTQVIVHMYNGLVNYWHLMLGGIALTILTLYLVCRTKQGQITRDALFLKIPLIGPVLQKAAMTRFASIFSLLQASGVSILDSIGILSDVIGNAAISKDFSILREKLREGRGISGPLRSSKCFTPMIISMIAVGEETGNLDEMLQAVADHYDYEVEYAIGRMSEMIGPILILLLSGVVGFFALAIFMPMWDLTKTV